jgi:hypothetical protein
MCPQSKGLPAIPEGIEKKLFHSTHENGLFNSYKVVGHAQLGRIAFALTARDDQALDIVARGLNLLSNSTVERASTIRPEYSERQSCG